jgi:hypothetical protein
MDKNTQKTISFKFSGFSGDIVWYLGAIKQVCEDMNAKAAIYIWLNQPGKSYEGADHPYGEVMVTRYAFDMLKPLAMHQSFVASFEPWNGETITVDMDLLRQVIVGMPYGNLAHWIGMKFIDMQPDWSQSWLETGNTLNILEGTSHKIIVNRTTRFRNHNISYFFLKDYQDHVLFAGLPIEHEAFNKEWSLKTDYLQVTDFLDLARHIAACKFFLGNQSMCFAIAEGLKIPRILEVCVYAPNVHPVGQYAHYFSTQEGVVNLTAMLDRVFTKTI